MIEPRDFYITMKTNVIECNVYRWYMSDDKSSLSVCPNDPGIYFAR